MANKTEFSRLVTKGSSVSGITPTVNSGNTIDATWANSDILNREMFINVEDKKVFIRANDDILEFVTQYSGSTPLNDFCSTGVKSDSYSACTGGGQIDLAYGGNPNDILISNDNGAYGAEGIEISPNSVSIFSFSTPGIIGIQNNTGTFSMRSDRENATLTEKNIVLFGGGLVVGTQLAGEIQVRENTLSAVTTNLGYENKAVFIGTKNSTINSAITNTVVIGGRNMSANENDSVYVPKLNVGILTGTSVSNLGVDSNGFIVTGGTGSFFNKYTTTTTLSAGNNTITHNLGITPVMVQVYNSAGVMVIPNEITLTSSNATTIKVASTMTSARIIIIG